MHRIPQWKQDNGQVYATVDFISIGCDTHEANKNQKIKTFFPQ